MKDKQKDVRLNKDLRKAYVKDFRAFLESKSDNDKYLDFTSSLKLAKQRIKDAFDTAKLVVERTYNPDDVAQLRKLQDKYSTVDATDKDSCFYFAVINKDGEVVEEREPDHRYPVEKKKHFNFELNGSLNGSEYGQETEFARAWYRNEMKANGLNPDCHIEHRENHSNPNLTKQENEIHSWLGGRDGGGTNYYDMWKHDYALDIIGSGGCRSRAIPCSHKEFAVFELMLIAKQNVVKCHEAWISAIVKATKIFEEAISSCKYKSEVDSIAAEYDWEPNVSINKTFGTAMTINPKSLKGFTDSILGYAKQPTRAEKIALAKLELAKVHSKLAS